MTYDEYDAPTHDEEDRPPLVCDGSGEFRFNNSRNNDPQEEDSFPCRGCENCA